VRDCVSPAVDCLLSLLLETVVFPAGWLLALLLETVVFPAGWLLPLLLETVVFPAGWLLALLLETAELPAGWLLALLLETVELPEDCLLVNWEELLAALRVVGACRGLLYLLLIEFLSRSGDELNCGELL
jgi:hypothetical protein